MEMVFLNLPSLNTPVVDLPPFVDSLLHDTDERSPEDERARLLSALLSTRWNVSEVARQFKWSRMTIYRRLAKHHILRPDSCNTPVLAVTHSHVAVTEPDSDKCDTPSATSGPSKHGRQPLTTSLIRTT